MNGHKGKRQNSAQTDDYRLLRLPEVLYRCGISRYALYEMVAQEQFLPPVRIGVQSVGWRATDIIEWIDSRPPATGFSGLDTDGNPSK